MTQQHDAHYRAYVRQNTIIACIKANLQRYPVITAKLAELERVADQRLVGLLEAIMTNLTRDKLVEIIARASNPDLFSSDYGTAHRAASPSQLSYARRTALDRIRFMLAVISEHAAIVPRRREGLMPSCWSEDISRPEAECRPVDASVGT